MKILDKEFEVDVFDADFVDNISAKDLEYKEKLEKAKTLKEECEIYKGFFDSVLGENASQKLFGNKNNLKLILDAYNDLISESTKGIEYIEQRKADMEKKYARYTK